VHHTLAEWREVKTQGFCAVSSLAIKRKKEDLRSGWLLLKQYPDTKRFSFMRSTTSES